MQPFFPDPDEPGADPAEKAAVVRVELEGIGVIAWAAHGDYLSVLSSTRISC